MTQYSAILNAGLLLFCGTVPASAGDRKSITIMMVRPDVSRSWFPVGAQTERRVVGDVRANGPSVGRSAICESQSPCLTMGLHS